jgi:hypothetical protein
MRRRNERRRTQRRPRPRPLPPLPATARCHVCVYCHCANAFGLWSRCAGQRPHRSSNWCRLRGKLRARAPVPRRATRPTGGWRTSPLGRAGHGVDLHIEITCIATFTHRFFARCEGTARATVHPPPARARRPRTRPRGIERRMDQMRGGLRWPLGHLALRTVRAQMGTLQCATACRRAGGCGDGMPGG